MWYFYKFVTDYFLDHPVYVGLYNMYSLEGTIGCSSCALRQQPEAWNRASCKRQEFRKLVFFHRSEFVSTWLLARENGHMVICRSLVVKTDLDCWVELESRENRVNWRFSVAAVGAMNRRHFSRCVLPSLCLARSFDRVSIVTVHALFLFSFPERNIWLHVFVRDSFSNAYSYLPEFFSNRLICSRNLQQ